MAVFDPRDNSLNFNPVASEQQNLKPSIDVAKATPGIYAAAAKSGLNQDEKRLIETWSYVQGTHKKLMGMNAAQAGAEFDKLDPNLQENLNYYFDTDYAHKSDDNSFFSNPTFKKIMGSDKGGTSIGDVLKSPFRALFTLGAEYGRLINTPGNWSQMKAAGTNVTLDQAHDGVNLFNPQYVDPLIKKYGGQNSYVAMKLLSGMTPGEIIQSWGPEDPEMLVAINKAFNDPENFQAMLNEFENTKISPGRYLGHKINETLNINEKDHPWMWKIGTGSIDMAYQIFADPLTYLTVGASAVGKGFGKLGKAENILKGAASVAEHFANPKVREAWTGLSEQIGKYGDELAAKNDLKAAEIRTEIKNQYPEYANDTTLELFARGDDRIKDLGSAIDFFTKAENTSLLIRGRVNGIKYFREGAMVARKGRNFKTGIRLKTREMFQGKTDFSSLDNDYNTLVDELVKVGENMDGTADVKNLMAIVEKNTKKGIRGGIERLSAKFPGNRKIYTSDERYAETLDLVREQSYVALGSKAMAEAVAIKFANSTQFERITLRKALDETFMRKIGVDKVPGGEKFMSDILNSKYGYTGGMTASDKLVKPARFNDGVIGETVDVTGSLLPFQNTEAIGSLPWREIDNFMAKRSLDRIDSKADIVPKLIGGAFNNHVTDMVTNVWSVFTLAPRLGIRTAIDEGFMLSMYLTTGLFGELKNAKRAGNVMTAFTGSKMNTGPVKDALQGFLTGVTKRNVGARRAITDAEREGVINKYNDLYDQGLIQSHEIVPGIKSEVLDMAISRMGAKLPPEYITWIREAAELNPRMLDDASAQQIQNVLFNKTSVATPQASLLNKSQLDKSIEDMQALFPKDKIEIGQEYNKLIAGDLDKNKLLLAMYHNFYTAFATSPYKLAKNDFLSPAALFVQHNGLRTAEDLRLAKNDFMQKIGFKVENDGTYRVINQEKAENFLNQSRQNMALRTGQDISKVAEDFADATFYELSQRFHGNADNINEAMINHFQTQFNDAGEAIPTYLTAERMSFDEYKNLVGDNLSEGMIMTPIDFGPKSQNLADWALRYGMDKIFPAMARTTDDLFRQPAVHAHYFLYRKQYGDLQKEYATQLFDGMKDQAKYTGMKDLSFLQEHADRIASRYFAEHAMEDAVHNVLKYSDNPEVRTMFANNMRNAGRFYRAVEDFHRRMYRLVADNGIAATYKARLMNQGLSAVGSVHHDRDGKSYVVMPMDDSIFHAVDTGLRALSRGKLGVNQPLFNDITFKLSAGNPSFQDDAGVPYLSGPMGSLSVMGVKAVLGKFNPTKNLAEDLDNMLLGNIGDNPTLRKAVVPKGLDNVWKLLTYDEKSQQEVSAAMQAIAYNQANGYGVDPQDPKYLVNGQLDTALYESDLLQYQKDVQITAHNVLWLRNLLGLISPITPTLQDGKDLPSYVKDAGIATMHESFIEVLQSVEKMYPGAEDPYELTLATWSGENKGKLPYLVSKSDPGVKTIMNYSTKMQDWLIQNSDKVEEYGNAAVLFAPNIGEFSPGVYNWAKAAGLVNFRTVESYLNEVTIQEAMNTYFDLSDEEDSRLKGVPLPDARRQILDEYDYKRNVLKMTVPFLDERISKLNNEDKVIFASKVRAAANDPGLTIAPEVRDLVNQSFEVFNGFMSAINSPQIVNSENATEVKRTLKSQALDQLDALSSKDTSGVVKQIIRNSFKGLMTYKVHDAQNTIR